jgi:hypothetical protein
MIHVELHKTYKNQQAHCALPAKPSLHSFISSQQNTDENSFFSLNMVTSSCSLRGDIYVMIGLHSDDKKAIGCLHGHSFRQVFGIGVAEHVNSEGATSFVRCNRMLTWEMVLPQAPEAFPTTRALKPNANPHHAHQYFRASARMKHKRLQSNGPQPTVEGWIETPPPKSEHTLSFSRASRRNSFGCILE